MVAQKVDSKGQRFIKENWFKLSTRQIAFNLGVSQTTVREWGDKLGLGNKPWIKKDKRHKQSIAGERLCERMPENLTFAEMVRYILAKLTAKRMELIAEQEHLEQCQLDPDGKIAVQIQAAKRDLDKIESIVTDYETLSLELDELGYKQPGIADEPETIEELFKYLDLKEVREKEGRLAGKVAVAANVCKADWQELTEFEDGSLDPCLLCPEGVLANE
jgi:hypothetical protein